MAKKKIVIGVIGSDCHTVGNKIIHSKLEENGFEIIDELEKNNWVAIVGRLNV